MESTLCLEPFLLTTAVKTLTYKATSRHPPQ